MRTIKYNWAAVLFTFFFGTSSFYAQDCTDSNTGGISSGSYYKYCDGILKSNASGVNYHGTSKAKYRSATHIQLKTGFVAGEHTGVGYFDAYINDADLSIIAPTSGPYGQYNKIEFALELDQIDISRKDYDNNWNYTSVIGTDLNTDIADFFTDFNNGDYPSVHTNPYDPDDINIEVTFENTSTSKTYTTWAFYYRDYEHDVSGTPSASNLPVGWNELAQNNGWRIRFAPPETGNYEVSIQVTTYQNTAHKAVYQYSGLSPFTVSSSSNEGYLEFVQGSKRMSFSKTGNVFFPIGTNLVSDIDENRYTSYAGEYYLMREYIKNLTGRGNYTRITFNTNGYPIEYDDPGCYDAHQETMWELDKMLELAEDSSVYVLLSLMIWEEFWHSPNGNLDNHLETDGNLNTRAIFKYHPYKEDFQLGDGPLVANSISGSDPLTDFFGAADSKKLIENRLQYIIARWGYSTSISAYDIFGEIDNTMCKWNDTYPYSRNINQEAETGLVSTMHAWVEDMAQYLEANDSNHLKTVCLFAYDILPFPATNVFDIEELDYIAFDDYGSRRNHNLANRSTYVEQFLNNTGGRNPNNKPVEILEFGHQAGHHSHVIEMYNPSSVHNAFWSSSMMGAIGSGSYFYKHYISDVGLKKAKNGNNGTVYANSVTFTGENPPTGVSTTARDYFWPCWYHISDGNTPVRKSKDGSTNIGGTTNITPDFTHHLYTLNHFMNDLLPNVGVDLTDNYEPQKFPDNTTDINATAYYNTNSLEAFTLVYDSTKAVGWVHNRSSYWGNIDFIDAYNETGNTCGNYKSLNGFSITGTPSKYLYDGDDFVSPADGEDDDVNYVLQWSSTMPLFKVKKLKKNTSYTIRWYNTLGTNTSAGITSPPGTPTITANTNSSGELTIYPPDMTDSDDHDYAYVIAEGGNFSRIAQNEDLDLSVSSSFSIYPNPHNGQFNVTIDNEGSVVTIQVFDVMGKQVYSENAINNAFSIDISDQPKGVYMVKLAVGDQLFTEKIIYQ